MIESMKICKGLVFIFSKKDAIALHININTDKYLLKFKVISVEKKEVKCLIYGVDNEESEDIAVFDFEYVSRYGNSYNAEQPKSEAVNHPNHYAWLKELCGIEPIDICRHLDFNCGSAVKYILRKGKKEMNLSEREQRVQYLSKAIFYLQDEIDTIKKSK